MDGDTVDGDALRRHFSSSREDPPAWNQGQIKVVTTPTLPGYEVVEVLGAVFGLTVRTRGVGGKFLASVEGVFGGEVTSYSSECEKARAESLERLIDDARQRGANAILAVDFETSEILQGTATVFSAYGTAVIVKPARTE
jgi:uncharacterized protein YbjQ (UPF0145 family)